MIFKKFKDHTVYLSKGNLDAKINSIISTLAASDVHVEIAYEIAFCIQQEKATFLVADIFLILVLHFYSKHEAMCL